MSWCDLTLRTNLELLMYIDKTTLLLHRHSPPRSQVLDFILPKFRDRPVYKIQSICSRLTGKSFGDFQFYITHVERKWSF